MLQFCNIFSDKKVMLFLKAYHFDRVNVRKYENFLDCIFDWLYLLNFNNFNGFWELLVPSHFLISKIEKYRKFTTATILEKFQISNVVQKYVRECILSQKIRHDLVLKKKEIWKRQHFKNNFSFFKNSLERYHLIIVIAVYWSALFFIFFKILCKSRFLRCPIFCMVTFQSHFRIKNYILLHRNNSYSIKVDLSIFFSYYIRFH